MQMQWPIWNFCLYIQSKNYIRINLKTQHAQFVLDRRMKSRPWANKPPKILKILVRGWSVCPHWCMRPWHSGIQYDCRIISKVSISGGNLYLLPETNNILKRVWSCRPSRVQLKSGIHIFNFQCPTCASQTTFSGRLHFMDMALVWMW